METLDCASRKSVSLALQGGGSHGAFTWGVLDCLLADGRLSIAGLSGTSAGAVNAVALASGLATAQGSADAQATASRGVLTQVWEDVGHWGALGELHSRFGRALWGGFGHEWARSSLHALSTLVSPYQANPLNLNPLRDLLARRIDFEAIRAPGRPPVFVSATHVSTGKARIFHGARLNADAVLASASLPTLFPAVEIDAEPYWDGGYAVNPPLTPLIDSCGDADIVIIQINPLRREGAPRTAREILDRMNELTFNASLLTQVRAIDLINRMLAEGSLAPGTRKLVRLHRIDGGADMLAYSAASKSRSSPTLLRELFAIGQAAARRWLDAHYDDLGRHGTINIADDYLDDTRLDWRSSTLPGC
ncbi:patatin-like phospholipase family protein [Ramlibacter sp. AN1015]|uniref:patatin-like phospholipase family protein n=1 Tax=Ramlibacter sp. AN1015 TaxID=3133428 RepID=UPI0030C58F8F